MINIKKNENYNKSCDYRLASVYRGPFRQPLCPELGYHHQQRATGMGDEIFFWVFNSMKQSSNTKLLGVPYTIMGVPLFKKIQIRDWL